MTLFQQANLSELKTFTELNEPEDIQQYLALKSKSWKLAPPSFKYIWVWMNFQKLMSKRKKKELFINKSCVYDTSTTRYYNNSKRRKNLSIFWPPPSQQCFWQQQKPLATANCVARAKILSSQNFKLNRESEEEKLNYPLHWEGLTSEMILDYAESKFLIQTFKGQVLEFSRKRSVSLNISIITWYWKGVPISKGQSVYLNQLKKCSANNNYYFTKLDSE